MSYRLAFFQIAFSVLILITIVPLHELGHVILGYFLGQQIIFVQWLDLQALIEIPIHGISGTTLGYVMFDNSRANILSATIQNIWYHDVYYLIALVVLVLANGRILRFWAKKRGIAPD